MVKAFQCITIATFGALCVSGVLMTGALVCSLWLNPPVTRPEQSRNAEILKLCRDAGNSDFDCYLSTGLLPSEAQP